LIGQFNPLADRFLYLPLTGFVLTFVPPLSSLFSRISRPASRAVAAALIAVVLSSFVLRALVYQRAWDNERALWDATLACNPRSWNALLGAGVARFEAGEVSAAGPFWSEMLRRQPNDGVSLMLVALLEEKQGSSREADRLFARALKAEPALAEPDRFARYYGWRPRMRAVLDSLLARAKI
jgi:tetratricopeptide (TPR) repeat protein